MTVFDAGQQLIKISSCEGFRVACHATCFHSVEELASIYQLEYQEESRLRVLNELQYFHQLNNVRVLPDSHHVTHFPAHRFSTS